MIWDCSLGKVVIEVDTGEPVLAVCLRRDLIIAIMEKNITVFSFSDIPIRLFCVRTWLNPLGLCAVSLSMENPFMVYPSSSASGSVEVVNLVSHDRRRLWAHSHKIQALSFNQLGIFRSSFFIL